LMRLLNLDHALHDRQGVIAAGPRVKRNSDDRDDGADNNGKPCGPQVDRLARSVRLKIALFCGYRVDVVMDVWGSGCACIHVKIPSS